ncbi:nucleoid-associated protein [Bacillus sp. FSL H8-0547]
MSITIKQMIAHDMDLKKESPLLAPDIINLTSVPTVIFDFFTRHIQNSLNARQIKACTFNDSSTYVQTKVNVIAKNLTMTPIFVNETHELTKDLFLKMKATSSKSSGALFFLIYDIDGEDYLGIMKMDQNNGIQINKVTFSLEVQENMLPNPEDKLHKCAFIKLISDFKNENVHLHILDRQKASGEVSQFFMNSFLQSNEILNDKIMTKRVVDKLHEIAERIVPKEQVLPFQFSIDRLFQNGKEIDLDLDLEKLVIPYINEEKQRADFIESFKTSLRSEFEDVKFQFKAEKEPTVMCFNSAGKEIKIEFPIEFFGTLVKIDQSTQGKTIITIEDMELLQKTK